MCDAHRLIGSSIFNLQGVGPEVSFHTGPDFKRYTVSEGEHEGWKTIREVIETPSGRLSQLRPSGGIEGDPLVSKIIEPFIKQRSDYEILIEYLEERSKGAEISASETEKARDYVGDDGVVGHWMPDSLYSVAQMCSTEKLIIDLVEAEELISELLDTMHKIIEIKIEAFNASPAEVLVYDICWGSTSLLSPPLVKKYVIPEAEWAVQKIPKGKFICFFTSGRTRDVLPELVATGVHCIQHFDVLGDCELSEVKRRFGTHICICGNLNPVVLSHGTVEEAKREARRCLSSAKEGWCIHYEHLG